MHQFLDDGELARYQPLVGRENMKRVIARVLDGARAGDASLFSFERLRGEVAAKLDVLAAEDLTSVINATGVLLHTNLGRAPLSAEALQSAENFAGGYSNLEFDLIEGQRGSRYSRLSSLLRETTGAQDGLLVNNCAAAVLLVLDTFAKGREVVISRNQLIEVGGGFRLPDVFARSGATLVEVGATNKVYLTDYERALTAHSALIFRSHLSNFSMSGFTQDVAPRDLSALGARVGIPVFEDLGSGALVDLAQFGLPHERTVPEAIGDGMDLVAFSGDKLLGGPQAGIIVGRSSSIARLRANPLLRALRVDKVTIAMLGATLRAYQSQQTMLKIPFYRMLSQTVVSLRERAAGVAAQIPGARVAELSSFVGGGSLSQAQLPSAGIAISDANGAVTRALRAHRPPVIGRTENGELLLDLRTVAPQDDKVLTAALSQRL